MHCDGRARASGQDPSEDCFLYGRLVSSNCDRESACEVGKNREAAYVLLGLRRKRRKELLRQEVVKGIRNYFMGVRRGRRERGKPDHGGPAVRQRDQPSGILFARVSQDGIRFFGSHRQRALSDLEMLAV